MNAFHLTCFSAYATALLLFAAPCLAQTQPATAPLPASLPSRSAIFAPELQGRTIEAIRILGNRQVSNNVILNVVRSREGQSFDAQTVQEDYQRIFDLKRFANVEAKVEPTVTGVIVVFIVTEQRQITSISFSGNKEIDTATLQEAADLKVAQAIDRFRITLARQAIQNLYKEKNYPYAHVETPDEPLTTRGELIFQITEGPMVRVRKVDFIGRHSFSHDKLLDQIKTRHWIWIFRAGTFDPEMIEDDVGALRQFYRDKGFFDVRVGRKIIVSPDQTEVQVDFLIEEGQRYLVERVRFQGNKSVPDEKLRANLRLLEGQPWDSEVLQRDTREIVRAYSPFGFVYLPESRNPDYLRIDAKPIFRREAGRVELLYQISEGRPFKLGRILVSGNYKSQDKLVLREMRVSPGQLYNSAELQEASDRLRALPYFSSVKMTPIGEDPQVRDVLVEVQEAKTASFTIGAGVNSNGGIGGSLTYEQRNFDITNLPTSWTDVFSDRAFTGAGQNLRITLEPGTEQTNAGIRFAEPYIFDLPYSFFIEGYLRNRFRESYEESHIGGRTGFGKRFDYENSILLAFRGEDVEIHDIDDPLDRAAEILALRGHSTLTSAGISWRRNTTAGGLLPYRGTDTTIGFDQFGALGGDFSFQKYSADFKLYQTVYEDLQDRKTILLWHADSGYITGQAPFFERFYGGGIGSLRGFEFRGISPRQGRLNDRVGGEFELTGGVELNFPLLPEGEMFRGVIFSDAGTVAPSGVNFNPFRISAGAGIRILLPFLGQTPIAVDFALPIAKGREDDTQLISFSFGFIQ